MLGLRLVSDVRVRTGVMLGLRLVSVVSTGVSC